MIQYEPLLQWLQQHDQPRWADALREIIQQRFTAGYHGDFPKWQHCLQQLPDFVPTSVDLAAAAIRVGECQQIADTQREQLMLLLQQLQPWRKGPFSVFGIEIDTEWRSDWKWDRLKAAITPLSGRAVLDVGCGSGYHCWRMAGAGAARVVGIEPMLLSVMQYQAIQHFVRDPRVHVLPMGTQDMPTQLGLFDTVFSMGLLYHQREPSVHLQELQSWLRPGGELVLETLVIEGDSGDVLVPKDRYASMRNVWAIPSCATLQAWLSESGYKAIRLVDVSATSSAEQRQTPWMKFKSLADFLDPHDKNKTIEGYPAPRRAIFVATT